MKLLVVKRDKIGDLLLTTPLFAHLKASLPGVELHLLANDYNAWVVAGNADIDRQWVYRRVRSGGRVSVAAAWEWVWQWLALRRERYDWVIVANGDESPRAVRRALSVRGAHTVAYCADASRYAGLSDPLAPDRAGHEVDRLLAMAAPLGIAPPAAPILPRYVLPEESAALPEDLGRSAEQSLRDFVHEDLGGLRLSVAVRSGHVWERIAHAASALKEGLVVMSTAGEDSFKDHLLGSNTERVVRHAACPVLVV